MKFLELTLENFRSYASKTSIKFSTSSKPIYTFIGDTGAGKTTIFLAIIWALYGEEAIKRFASTRKQDAQAPRNNLDLINKDSISGKAFMRVTLNFEHDSEKYYLIRTAASKYAPQRNSDIHEDLSLRKGASGKEEHYAQGIIKDILPIDASQFFFFDGEDVRKYSGATSIETKDAIERVLGIPEVREARDDIKRMTGKFLKQLGEHKEIDDEISKISRSLAIVEHDYEDLGKKLEDARKGLTKVRGERTQLEAKRETIKDITDLNSKLKDISKDIDATQSGYEELVQRRDELVKDLPFFLVAPTLREVLQKFKKLTGTDDLGKQIQDVSARIKIVEELLAPESSLCYCNRNLTEGSKLHLSHLKSTLEAQLAELTQKSSKKTTPPIEEIQYVLGRIENINVDFVRHEQRIKEMQLKLIELDDGKRTIEDKIKDSNVTEAEKVQIAIESIRKIEGGLENEILTLEKQFGEKESLKRRLESSLRTNQLALGRSESASQMHLLTTKLFDAFSWIVDAMYKHKKAIIVQNASSFFQSVAPREGYKGVDIEDDYSVWLVDNKGERVKPSEGYKELVALSLIYGLNKAASYNAPVVMDFVLGRLDSSRQLALVKNLHDFAEQVLILLLDSETKSDGVQDKLQSLSAMHYSIERDVKKNVSYIEVRK